MSRQKVWESIWSKKYESYHDHKDLHVAAGYDMLSYAQYQTLASYFIDKLSLQPEYNFLEVGCGCGAFLEHVNKRVRSVSGIDYSSHAIARLKGIMEGEFEISQASKIPFDANSFDCITSFGVFIYFESYDYATRVMDEMLRALKPGGTILIGDVSDIARIRMADNVRKTQSSDRETRRVSEEEADHLYYASGFFLNYASQHDLNCEIINQSVSQLNFYPNASYRFSVIMSPVNEGNV
jgi:ubiquinone/menaquinone biosynthesis C-methylase UbiE